MSRPQYDDVQVGDQLPARTIAVTREHLVRYAGASGDFNPIHWNPRFATEVGLPDVIAHGMFTMGAAIELVTAWAGDPGAITAYGVRFTKPVGRPRPRARRPRGQRRRRDQGRRDAHRARRPDRALCRRRRPGPRPGDGPAALSEPLAFSTSHPAGDPTPARVAVGGRGAAGAQRGLRGLLHQRRPDGQLDLPDPGRPFDPRPVTRPARPAPALPGARLGPGAAHRRPRRARGSARAAPSMSSRWSVPAVSWSPGPA